LTDAVDDLAHAVLVLVELLLALHLAHALHDHLLGGLRGDAAEVDRRQRVDDELADRMPGLNFWAMRSGICVASFSTGSCSTTSVQRSSSPRRLAVDDGADVLLVPVLGAAGLLDGLLHRLQHLVALDHLLARDGVGDLQQLGARDGRRQGQGA
jgi:hypothetical protein